MLYLRLKSSKNSNNNYTILVYFKNGRKRFINLKLGSISFNNNLGRFCFNIRFKKWERLLEEGLSYSYYFYKYIENFFIELSNFFFGLIYINIIRKKKGSWKSLTFN